MASSKDVQYLSRNDKELTYLQLLRPESDTTPSALTKLVNVLKWNTHVSRVRFFVQNDTFESDDEQEDSVVQLRRQLFHVVGSLPKLHQLKVDSYTGLAEFPVLVLSQTILLARHLQELELWDLKLAVKNRQQQHNNNNNSISDDNNHYVDGLQGLQLSLQHHPSLEKFTLYNCQLEAEDEKSNNLSLDPLLEALATIPTLKQVYITAAAAASAASNASVAFFCCALEQLCCSKSLQELGLWKFNFPHQSFASHQQQQSEEDDLEPLTRMAPAIAESNTLTMFEFGKCKLSPASDQALANMLAVNTSLEELDLHLHPRALGTAATTTTTNSHCSIVATAKALETTNQTLKRLKLWGLLSRHNQLALVEMMRHNYFIETCRLLDADRDVSVMIDFHTSLNRGGRRILLRNEKSITMKQWVDFLAGDAGKDLSILYYYLSMKPGLCRLS